LRADVAADIADQVEYANANAASWKLLDKESLENPAIYPDEEIWDRMFVIETADPVQERARTRALARAKSGL
jgi:putrescine transport system substrate-binding protein